MFGPLFSALQKCEKDLKSRIKLLKETFFLINIFFFMKIDATQGGFEGFVFQDATRSTLGGFVFQDVTQSLLDGFHLISFPSARSLNPLKHCK